MRVVERRRGSCSGAGLNCSLSDLPDLRSVSDGPVIVVAFVVMSTTSASQNLDYVIAVAIRYIQQHLGATTPSSAMSSFGTGLLGFRAGHRSASRGVRM